MKDTGADALRDALEAAVGGQYKVLRLLGRGAMGAVYLAREASLERLVAIKVLPPEAAGAADRRERFKREARTAARLTHPHIVPLHSFGESEAVTYFVMGYVSGESLAARLRREGRMQAEEARRILTDVAQALDHAHRQGVIHRDVKPDNILIDDESGRALLTDFGVARAAGSAGTLTEAGSILGTPHFMSPEQASGGAVDGRTDIYALGVTGYALLSGRLPFEGSEVREVVLQVLSKQPPPLASVAPEAPADLARAIDRCLAKDPAARWPDARSLAEVIGPAAGAEGPLPELLEELEERGFWLVLWALGAAYLGGMAFALRRELSATALTLFATTAALPLLVALGFVGRVWAARAAGSTWQEILRVAFRHPRNWSFWYPAGLRRAGDVWNRLPPEVKRVRLMGTIGIGFAFAFVISFVVGLALPENPVLDTAVEISFFAFMAFALVLLVEAARARTWCRRQRVSRGDRNRLLSLEPTSRPAFWKRPEIARLLLPAAISGGGAPTGEPRSPTDYLSAIERAVQRSNPQAPGRDAVEVARKAVSALRAMEQQKARLSFEADPAEAARLQQRLEVLGPETGSEPEERQQMRKLLLQQLELLERVQGRLDETVARHAGLLGALRELWRGLATAAAGGDAQERLRALCAEVERHAARDDVSELPTLPR